MNKKLNRGLAIIIPDKKANTFIMFMIILGIISGSLFLVVLKDTDHSLVIEKINTFFTNINTNNINNIEAFKNAFIENIIFVILVWILGMSIIGIIINIFMIYLKGFIIGFSLSSFFLVYKYKGLLAALIYAFPTSIINILVCLLLGVYSVLFTINLWKIIFLKEKDFNMKRFIKKYFLLLILCIILILISSLTESFLVPSLLKLVIKLFI